LSHITFGANMIETLRKLTEKPIDVHLMVVNRSTTSNRSRPPEPPCSRSTRKRRSMSNASSEAVKKRGMMAGLALNPPRAAHAEEVSARSDLLLIMTVIQALWPDLLGRLQ